MVSARLSRNRLAFRGLGWGGRSAVGRSPTSLLAEPFDRVAETAHHTAAKLPSRW